MERVDTAPDEYLASLPDDDRSVMSTLDELIVGAMPGRVRELWEGVFWGGTEQTIIGYGSIVQPRSRGEEIEWFAVGLALQSAHVSLYVNAVADGDYLGKQYADRLGKVKLGAASIAIKRLDDVDLAVLTELLERAHELTPPDVH
ncbi:MAG: DUF1801 domain-containing protein [Ilumatobacter sp.]|uniref:DUF1801 domain-containing protein n=1 Tax=Ilumatobacter sp. TaxID=1967498 RepID=UPI0026169001|nr:DUF1801 domain-containing protein [Ilumatobacter sp.]MDJ0768658.1 DUF1801 domain-containing protein [Ilumatobacter sp.]